MLKTDIKSMSDSLDECLADMASIDVDYLCCSAEEQLLSDDIWKKFEFEPLSDFTGLNDIFFGFDSQPDPILTTALSNICEIRNHDCMWAGHCGSKEHPANEPTLLKPLSSMRVLPPGPEKTPAVKQQPMAAGRSLLLKTVIKPTPVPLLPSPESPPISDDEDPKGETSTLKMLNDAINECDIEEDSDLCDYFEEGEGEGDDDIVVEPEEPPPAPPKPREVDHSYHDHSYYKDINSTLRIANLGIETPSDSEEEIDVVSVGEKQNIICNRQGYALPTNPSSRDKQQLQRTVASAITNKSISTNTIKTLPPVRKYTNRNAPVKKRTPESSPRGTKRSKNHYYKTSPTYQPYKRRATQTGNSSDSEPELEKRSLHNNMERQRRIDLRNSFEDLRRLVPEVCSRERAAKVVILREAAMYCDHLSEVSDTMVRKVQDLRRRQEYLRIRVSQLRKSLAAKR